MDTTKNKYTDLGESFVKKIQNTETICSREITHIKEICDREIKDFEKHRKYQLKKALENKKEQNNKIFSEQVDDFLRELLISLDAFREQKVHSKKDHEDIIAVLNVYQSKKSYFWIPKQSLLVARAEKEFTELYLQNIKRWTRLFGKNYHIERTLTAFFTNIELKQSSLINHVSLKS